MITTSSRREFLATTAAASVYMTSSRLLRGQEAPAGRVAIGHCPEYNHQVVEVLAKLFDQLGGLERLVRGKTVAVKINLTGPSTARLRYISQGMSFWSSPRVIAATVYLLGRAGARRIRILEGAWATTEPLEQFMLGAGWDLRVMQNAAPHVEFENTNFLGSYKTYARFMVPHGGLLFTGYDMNCSYRDCDVFVSLAKLKVHSVAGITLSMKNCFGNIPCTIYSEDAPADEPALAPVSGRQLMHAGNRQPPKSAPPAVNLNAPKQAGYRIPRAVADIVAARPVDLALIDGIYTMNGAEIPDPRHQHTWLHPGLLIAGTNCVSTDAVAMALMGFDPMADRGTAPFETADSTLRLAEDTGVGTRDLSRIEVAGPPIQKLRFDILYPAGSVVAHENGPSPA
jgi:uncharacterized protein (DUF362 family)